ncbi:unnamed protein product [Rotaria sp. Silwood2]|nr:unnamed protein product [Rotaria sp. Silwood2]
MTIIALTAAILGIVINRLDSKNTSSIINNQSILLSDQIKIEDLIKHLEQLQLIADRTDNRTPGANFDEFVRIVVIPNLGCEDNDWINVSKVDSVALVKRGNCSFSQKCALADKYQVKGLFIYNDGISSDGFNPIQGVRNNLNTTIPAYFLSYNLGMQLVNTVNNVSVIININVSDANGIENICADTQTGDPTKTIVIGAHSDGVSAGSGINDNGSGTVAILALAINLARLFQTSSLNYSTYQYRVRFCWWGAEELGLLGSRHHVEQASLPTTIILGERLQD